MKEVSQPVYRIPQIPRASTQKDSPVRWGTDIFIGSQYFQQNYDFPIFPDISPSLYFCNC